MNAKAYEVHLEVFEGPLDLLLYLIRKDDLDIENIPIASITAEYLGYLDLMKELNLDVAGDFLVMAATLMQIKARALLPSQEGEPPEGPDPRLELVSKLQEYRKFKEAAGFLQKRADDWSDVFYRGAPAFAERDKALNIRIFDLLTTLREVLDRAEAEGRVVTGEEYPIERKMEQILALLAERPYVPLREVFAGERRRRAIISCFLALLELIKLQRVFARQEGPFAEILVYRKEAPPEVVTPLWPGEEEPKPAAPLEAGPLDKQAWADAPAEAAPTASEAALPRDSARSPEPDAAGRAPGAEDAGRPAPPDTDPEIREESDGRP